MVNISKFLCLLFFLSCLFYFLFLFFSFSANLLCCLSTLYLIPFYLTDFLVSYTDFFHPFFFQSVIISHESADGLNLWS